MYSDISTSNTDFTKFKKLKDNFSWFYSANRLSTNRSKQINNPNFHFINRHSANSGKNTFGEEF